MSANNQPTSSDESISLELVTPSSAQAATDEIDSTLQKVLNATKAILKKAKASRASRGSAWKPPESYSAYLTVHNIEKRKQMPVPAMQDLACTLFQASCRLAVNEKIWTPLRNGHPTVEDSVKERTGMRKAAIWDRGKEMKKSVNNVVSREFYKLFPGGLCPSGVMPEEALQAVKQAYYATTLTEHAIDRMASLDVPITWADGPWLVFEAHGPLSKEPHVGLSIRATDPNPDVDNSRKGQRKADKSEGTPFVCCLLAEVHAYNTWLET